MCGKPEKAWKLERRRYVDDSQHTELQHKNCVQKCNKQTKESPNGLTKV